MASRFLAQPKRPPETLNSINADLARVIAGAGIDPALESVALQEAVHCAIALHRASCTWTKVCAGWVVKLQFPEARTFFGETLEEALAWCLFWLMTRKHATALLP